jgi:predicted O-methyltransferase YrrM
MSNSPDIEIIDGTTFELRPHHRNPTHQDWVCLRKNRNFTNRYLALAEEFRRCRMVEVGVDQGGSTSFFTKLFQPEALLAIELSSKPVASVTQFLARHDPDAKVSIHWGVDQSDRVEVPRLVDAVFHDEPLNLVVDDASHLLAPTTATFEMLFPRLRPGGLYIIEDWSCSHLDERGYVTAIAADPNGKAAKIMAAAIEANPSGPFEKPMSLLICQLVVAAGRNPDWITEVRATDGFCEIRRGDADIAPGTPIASYVGQLGSQMFKMNPA